MLARLDTAVSREPMIKMGSLVAPLGRRMQSDGETLKLVAQFPNIMVTEEVAAPAAAPNVWTCG
jgi:hypothetical protein